MRDGLARAGAEHDIVAVLFCGGSEKVSQEVFTDPASFYGFDVTVADDPVAGLAGLIEGLGPEAVIDMADEPVLKNQDKFDLASITLNSGVEFLGPGYRLSPPPFQSIETNVPKIAVIGTGKRTGKTAITAHLAQLLKERGERPVVVSMGRGGPAQPQVIKSGAGVDLQYLIEIARAGGHAASDYIEDAVLAGVDTVGCRRVGGGLAGQPSMSNVVEGVEMAMGLEPTILILEGSGATLPPVEADATICVTSAPVAAEQALRYLGPLRLIRSDMVVVTGAGPLNADERNELKARLSRWCSKGTIAFCELKPEPTVPIGADARIAYFTTAEGELQLDGLKPLLYSNNLARRGRLTNDLERAAGLGCDTYIAELKAASVELVGEAALARGVQMAFVNNRPVGTGVDLDRLLIEQFEEADGRCH